KALGGQPNATTGPVALPVLELSRLAGTRHHFSSRDGQGGGRLVVRAITLLHFRPQFSERLLLNLPDAFARQPEMLTDFLERSRRAILQAKAQRQDLAFAPIK